MNNRGIWIALGIFVLAFAVFYFADVRGPSPTTNATPSPQSSPILDVSAPKVASIVITGKGKVLTMSLSDNKWSYSLCPADKPGSPAQPADTPKATALLL